MAFNYDARLRRQHSFTHVMDHFFTHAQHVTSRVARTVNERLVANMYECFPARDGPFSPHTERVIVTSHLTTRGQFIRKGY